ncbi:hypothetical protein FGO68_gene13759 [Halteria grandinella]|uniref:Uncharacterized protein n=1 Tax=Halteria grandinella TaxID=5974 RepID=A0A8J8NWV9_HALGN|nr:hypothetical protein FGO68_gene13759 [Halteria grandinella]
MHIFNIIQGTVKDFCPIVVPEYTCCFKECNECLIIYSPCITLKTRIVISDMLYRAFPPFRERSDLWIYG